MLSVENDNFLNKNETKLLSYTLVSVYFHVFILRLKSLIEEVSLSFIGSLNMNFLNELL
jgi:hypothetical protein